VKQFFLPSKAHEAKASVHSPFCFEGELFPYPRKKGFRFILIHYRDSKMDDDIIVSMRESDFPH